MVASQPPLVRGVPSGLKATLQTTVLSMREVISWPLWGRRAIEGFRSNKPRRPVLPFFRRSRSEPFGYLFFVAFFNDGIGPTINYVRVDLPVENGTMSVPFPTAAE
jgi:hypothetical protein